MSRREIVHRCPLKGSGVTPCCGHTPFELPRTDRLTEDPALVTCKPMSDPTEEDLRLAREWMGGPLSNSEEEIVRSLAAFRAEARREVHDSHTPCHGPEECPAQEAEEELRLARMRFVPGGKLHEAIDALLLSEAQAAQSEREACERIVGGLRAENEALQHTLGLAHLHRSEVVWLEGFRDGVGKAFDTLGECRDERMMLLMREAQERAK